MKKKTFVTFLAFLFISPLIPGPQIDSAVAAGEKHIVIAGSHVAGTYYRLAGGIASLVDKYIPGVKATAQPSPGSVQNVRNLVDKSIDIGIVISSLGYKAIKGEKPFEKDPFPNLRGIFNTYPFLDNIITQEKSPVKTLFDVKGRRVATGPPGSGSLHSHIIILEAHGIKLDDCKPQYLTNDEAARALVDGNVDVALIEVPATAGVIKELMTMHKMRYVPVDMEVAKAIHKKVPYLYPDYVKAGTYECVKEDVLQMFQTGIFCADLNFDPELVYNIVKVMFEHKAELVQILKLAEKITPETAGGNMAIPLHPGAERYYREVGVLK
jgi:TRAP transporter TAXI family solute receptor